MNKSSDVYSKCIDSRMSGCREGAQTSSSVHSAMYAARSSGLTAVPVIHGMAAVLTMATRLHTNQLG